LTVLRVARRGNAGPHTLLDERGQAWSRYDAREGTLYLIRPDGYVLARWRDATPADVARALAPYVGEVS